MKDLHPYLGGNLEDARLGFTEVAAEVGNAKGNLLLYKCRGTWSEGNGDPIKFLRLILRYGVEVQRKGLPQAATNVKICPQCVDGYFGFEFASRRGRYDTTSPI